jgi:hypothetical protein
MTTTSNQALELGQTLSSPERHVLQKLYLWKDTALSVEEFRGKTAEALQAGWNNSGPLRASGALAGILQDMEYMVAQRLLAERLGH